MNENSKTECEDDKQALRESLNLDDVKNQNLQNIIPVFPRKLKIDEDASETEKRNEEQLLIDIANIKKEIHESGYQENPQMKFSVRVEVEEFNEDIRHNIKIEIQNAPSNEPQCSNSQIISQIPIITKLSKISDCNTKMRTFKRAMVNIDKLYEEVDKISITSNNPADKILARELKNNWGAVLRIPSVYDPINNKIQQAINKWKIWSSISRYRELPMFYKCYICEISWWHLEPFRTHLPLHPINSYNIDLEEHLHESNVIAYRIGNVPEMRNLNASGDCWRCNRSFDNHLLIRQQNSTYDCTNCYEQFYTCSELKNHVGVCLQYLRHLDKKEGMQLVMCALCKCMFASKEDMETHLVSRHSVRSDQPVETQSKICPTCDLPYFTQTLHYCPKKLTRINCYNCNRGFPTKLTSDIHMVLTESNVKCTMCCMVLKKKCLETTHYLQHTDMFRLAYKCMICPDTEVFLDEDSAKYHKMCVHKQNSVKGKNYFERVLLPKSYFSEEKPLIVPVLAQHTQKVPVIEAKQLNQTSQVQPMATLETQSAGVIQIKKEIEYDEDTYKYEEYQPKLVETCIENGTETFVFHDVPVSEKMIPPGEIKTEIKSEPIEEEYEDDIIRLSIDIPEADNIAYIKQEPEYDPIAINPDITYEEPEDVPQTRLYGYNQSKYKFPCSQCNRNFFTSRKYLLHFTTHGVPYMSCPVCLVQFENMTKLTPHVQSHVKQSYLKLRVIDNSPKVRKNKRKTARRPMKYQCKLCKCKVDYDNFYSHWDTHSKSGWKKDALNEQSAADMSLRSVGLKLVIANLVATKKTAQSLDCVICHRHFDRKNDCKRHLIEHLLTDAFSNKPTYGALRCQICHAGFQKQDRYKLHMRDHGSLPVYRCELCDRAFSDSSNFTKHKKVHNLQVVICDICSKKFQAKSSLIKHLEMHRTTQPITCKICTRVSYTESAFKKHYRRYHSNVHVKFRCQFCGKKFVTLKEKWDHLWIVHKERSKNADCPICKKAFRRYIDVKTHMIKEHSFQPARKLRRHDDINTIFQNTPGLKLPDNNIIIVKDD